MLPFLECWFRNHVERVSLLNGTTDVGDLIRSGEYFAGNSARSSAMWSFGRTRLTNSRNATSTFHPIGPQLPPILPNSAGLGLS